VTIGRNVPLHEAGFRIFSIVSGFRQQKFSRENPQKSEGIEVTREIGFQRQTHLDSGRPQKMETNNFQLIGLLARLHRITTGQWMALELAFETKALRDICESKATAKERLGAKVADALKRRLSDFQSIDTFDELPFTKPRKNSNNVSFNLPEGWRLIVTGGHGENPRLPDGKTDWTKVTRLKIVRIEQKK
jgi:hypothetical protein